MTEIHVNFCTVGLQASPVRRVVKASQVPLAGQDHKVREVSKDRRASEVTWEIRDSPEQPVHPEDLDRLEQLATLGLRVRLEIKASLAHKVAFVNAVSVKLFLCELTEYQNVF